LSVADVALAVCQLMIAVAYGALVSARAAVICAVGAGVTVAVRVTLPLAFDATSV
jgi:hypothetical protein